MNRTLIHLVAAAALVLNAGSAIADDDDHELARRALSEGKIRPLGEIMSQVRSRVPGEIIKVELEIEDGTYVYEFKVLGTDGKIQEIEVDAATAKILKIEPDD